MNKDELQVLALQKEKEWRAINEKRIEALEEELKNTIKSFEQEKQNFSQLKDDFKYNLKLLDERDKELANIEGYYNVLKKQQSDKDALISELKIEIDEFKKVLEKEKLHQDEAKKFYLERLQEKQLEFENYKLIKDNEIKQERSEIESHKRSLQNHIEGLKYDLERQKQEMKNEFDEIMRKREHEWRKGYDEQSTETLAKELQAKLLSNELEQIKEINKRLQNDFDDMESKYKKLERGLKEKDWELKDNISLKDAKIKDYEARIKELENNLKKQVEEFKIKFEKMDKTIREKDFQIQTLKENRNDFEKDIKAYKAEIEEKDRCMEKFIEEKGQIILNLTEEVIRLKSNNDSKQVTEKIIVNSKAPEQGNKQSYQELKAENNDLKAEKKLYMKYLADYKVKIEKSLEREQLLEQEKLQIDLDWQKKYQELENTKYMTSEDYLKKLSDSRNQAVAQVSSLEEKLKQKEAIINAMKSANPTLDALNFEVYENKYKEENEYLKKIVKQMRDEIETLASELPPNRDKFNNSNNSRILNKNQSENDITTKTLTISNKTVDSTLEMYDKSDNPILNDHVETLHQKISILRKEKLELTSYLKKQQIRVLHLEKNISNSSEQLNNKQAQIETLQYELNSQTRRYTNELNSLKQRIGELELELNESNKEADEYHKNVIQKESEVAGLELKISELKLKLSSSGHQINFGQQELFIQQLQDEIQRLNEKLLNNHNNNTNNNKIDGLTVNEINNMKEIKNLKTKLKTLAKHLSQLIHEKQQLIEMSNQLRAELEKTRRQYEDTRFKRLNNDNFITNNIEYPAEKPNQLKKLEDFQYNLTKKDLAFANIKNTLSQPNLKSNNQLDSSFTSENDQNNRTTSSSVRSENLQELWKILDDNQSQISTYRDYENDGGIKSILKNQQKSKNENIIDQPLSARGEKKIIQSKTIVKQKPKIRNYNLRSDE